MDARPRNFPVVGNDVVDLGAPAAQSALSRPRFVARICAADELERIRAITDPAEALVLVWSLFAAKEAAYKVIARTAPETVFAHRAFEVAPSLTEVRFAGTALALQIERRGEAIMALAWRGDITAADLVFGVASRAPDADPGQAARAALLSAVAAAEGLPLADLAVLRPPRPGSWDGHGPPVLTLRGRERPDPISLSHDGPYVAYAWFPVDETAG